MYDSNLFSSPYLGIVIQVPDFFVRYFSHDINFWVA